MVAEASHPWYSPLGHPSYRHMGTSATPTTPTATLYVATDLDCRELTTPGHDDVICDGKCFRRLAPDYYAWLRAQMERACQHHARGMIPDAHYQALRHRFNTMHDRAVALFGDGYPHR